jgi:hypothetical protein
MKKIILILVLTPNVLLHAQEKSASQEQSTNASQSRSIIDQLLEWAKALGIA